MKDYSHKPEIMQSTEKYVDYANKVLRDCPEKIMHISMLDIWAIYREKSND